MAALLSLTPVCPLSNRVGCGCVFGPKALRKASIWYQRSTSRLAGAFSRINSLKQDVVITTHSRSTMTQHAAESVNPNASENENFCTIRKATYRNSLFFLQSVRDGHVAEFSSGDDSAKRAENRGRTLFASVFGDLGIIASGELTYPIFPIFYAWFLLCGFRRLESKMRPG